MKEFRYHNRLNRLACSTVAINTCVRATGLVRFVPCHWEFWLAFHSPAPARLMQSNTFRCRLAFGARNNFVASFPVK